MFFIFFAVGVSIFMVVVQRKALISIDLDCGSEVWNTIKNNYAPSRDLRNHDFGHLLAALQPKRSGI